MEIFQVLFYEPTFNLLILFYHWVGNLGVAILLLAVVSRLITWPLTRRQVKNVESNKVFQAEVAKVKKKYKKNQEKQAQELAKLQAKYLPGQLGGCLNLIIALILLIQVRNVIINLVDQGAHAFNQVAYSESLKLREDSIIFDARDLESGVHELEYKIVANGNELEKTYIFALTEGKDSEQLRQQVEQKLNSISPEEQEQIEINERHSSMSLYVEEFADFDEDEPILLESLEQISAFIRPPSNTNIKHDQSVVTLNGEVLPEEKLQISEGQALNFSFLGADLSKVATDFGFSNPIQVAPYVIIAVSVGVTQFFSSKVQMGLNPAMTAKPTKDDKKKKGKKGKSGDKKEEDLDFGEILAQSSKQMTYVFPFITIVWSLGFFGAFFPTGVSLFWTGQNTFVIIQELITNRDKAKEKFRGIMSFFRNRTEAEPVKVKNKNEKKHNRKS